MALPVGTIHPKSKDHLNRKNSRSAEAAAERRKAANATTERKIAQLQYRLATIDESVAAGRQQYEDVFAEVRTLQGQLQALEAQHAVAR